MAQMTMSIPISMGPPPSDDSSGSYGEGSVSDLDHGPYKFSPVGLEVGLILGVLAITILGLAWMFYWRARKHRLSKAAGLAAMTTEHAEELAETGTNAPRPVPKDSRGPSTSTRETGDSTLIERPTATWVERRPMGFWNDWTQPSHQIPVEQHEIPSRA